MIIMTVVHKAWRLSYIRNRGHRGCVKAMLNVVASSCMYCKENHAWVNHAWWRSLIKHWPEGFCMFILYMMHGFCVCGSWWDHDEKKPFDLVDYSTFTSQVEKFKRGVNERKQMNRIDANYTCKIRAIKALNITDTTLSLKKISL